MSWGLVGGGRLAWPEKTVETKVPDWIVFGATIRTAGKTSADPGLAPELTALDEEGFAEVTSNHIIEGFARNLMLLLDAWHESGFAAISKSYFERFAREAGQRYDIDNKGDLLIDPAGETETVRKELLARLAKPTWLDLMAKGLA